jgi:tripartite-type tricarboxylate transporter receptor subunit TctC
MFKRRSLFAALLPSIAPWPALAQWVPERTIRMVAPFAAGGASDLIARMVAEEMTPLLGQQVVVENRTGAGGSVGTEAVVRARADGLTLLMGSQATHATNPALQKLSFDPIADLAGIGPVAGVPAVMVVPEGLPARTLGEFIAMAKARPGAVTYGSAGIGASTHLAGALLAQLAGIELQHVPYRGTALAMQDLIAGRINMMMDTLPTALPHIQGGRIRALAVSTTARNPTLPEVPTVAEAGVPGYEALNWYGVYAPAATPEVAAARLNQVLAEVVARPAFQARLASQGMLPLALDRAAFTAYASADRQRWTDLVRAANITPAD